MGKHGQTRYKQWNISHNQCRVNVPTPLNVETHPDTDPSTQPNDQDEHKTQTKQKVPTVNPHQHNTATETVTYDDNMNKTNSIDTMEEEQNTSTPDTHIT
jgi:hypothetical protein